LSEALFLLRKAESDGCFLKDYGDPEKAKIVLHFLEPMLSYDFNEAHNYGALIVRDTSVNVFSYWNPVSEEEENLILERNKRILWSKLPKRGRTWHKTRQSNKDKQMWKVLKYQK
tara:strand:- start:260 stop:604 length:345 start_codon:yes stop_codon:yes gene_type:complete